MVKDFVRLGKQPASPIPNRNRVTTADTKLNAHPVAAVKNDHQTTMRIKTRRAPIRSPRYPPGISNIEYASAKGVYSDVQGNTRHFLRGHQKTNSHGLAIFRTIYPGWYTGRTPHIHVKVHVGGNTVHTGQLFFKDAISDAVYRHGAYASHGEPNTTNARDSIYAQAGGGSAQLHLRRRSGASGYVGTITMGVRA